MYEEKTAATILKINIIENSQRIDKIVWSFTSHGQLTTKLAYQFLRNRILSPNTSNLEIWKMIWHPKISAVLPQKIVLFIWRCVKGILLVNANIARRRRDKPTLCTICNQQEKTIERSLFFC